MSRVPFRARADGGTLLDYAVFTHPDPLQAGTANAVLTLVASNPGGRAVKVQGLVVTLPVGTNARDLTADAGGLQVQVPQGWTAGASAGVVTLVPQGAAGEIGPAGMSFVFSAIAVNAQVGLATLTVDETASGPAQPARDRTAAIPLPKFPTQFFVSDLRAAPLDVRAGGSTTLLWTGSPAVYTLAYQPADQGAPVSQPVGDSGPFVAKGLTRAGQVTFTLVVQVPVPGLDLPLTVLRQVSVSVETLAASLTAVPPVVGPNGLARLDWSTSNAGQCRIDPGGEGVGGSGSLYVVVPQTRVYTLTAWAADGPPVQRQVTVTVDPAIVANLPGHQAAGAGGGRGADGPSGFRAAGNGADGGRGGDAVLTVTLPPLDSSSTPARVIPLAVTGGGGGPGGNGGSDWGARQWTTEGMVTYPPASGGGNGGNGGDGGNATLAATFSPAAGAPAQYVVSIAAGPGGFPGGAPGSGANPASPGRNGAPGVVAMTFDGLP